MNNSINNCKHRIVSFKRGEFLFKQNEMTHELFILKKGMVRIYKKEGGVEIELDTVGPGNIVGEISSIDGGPRTASGIAVEECDAILISYSELQSILSSIPEWFKKISLILVQRLREIDAKINNSIEGEWTDQIAAIVSLLAFSEYCFPCNEGFMIDRKTAEYNIIDLLDITMSEITASLERLNRSKYLNLDRGGIILSNRNALDGVAEKVFNSTEAIPVV